MISVRTLTCAAALAVVPSLSIAKTCGGGFNGWMTKLKAEAVASGHSKSAVNQFFRTARIDPKVLKADRAQGVFRLTFTEFAGRAISANRMTNGKKNMKKYICQSSENIRRATRGSNRVLGTGNRLRCGSGQFQHAERPDHPVP